MTIFEKRQQKYQSKPAAATKIRDRGRINSSSSSSSSHRLGQTKGSWYDSQIWELMTTEIDLDRGKINDHKNNNAIEKWKRYFRNTHTNKTD